jgi:uncharacterized HAD superfamily protein
MKLNATQRINPSELAFDIDGVVADTMAVFVQLAHERYGLKDLTKEHLREYDLHRCLDLDPRIVDDLICLTLDDEHTEIIPPEPEAPDVLTELAQHGPLRFVTARIWPESIIKWLHKTLPDVPVENIHVVATGAPEAKLQILKKLGIRYFLEDRVETCRLLAQDGIRPMLFDQPWNRAHSSSSLFPRIENWSRFRQWLAP